MAINNEVRKRACDSQSSQGSVTKSLRTSFHTKCATTTTTTTHEPYHLEDEDDDLFDIENIPPLHQHQQESEEQATATLAQAALDEIEEAISQIDEVKAPQHLGLNLRMEDSVGDSFWRAALFAWWGGYNECLVKNLKHTSTNLYKRTRACYIKPTAAIDKWIHCKGGSSLVSCCACGFNTLMTLPNSYKHALLPSCMIHVLPAGLGLNDFSECYKQHTRTLPPEDTKKLAMGSTVHRRSCFLQLRVATDDLPGPPPFHRIVTDLWVEFCVRDRHHYSECSHPFFQPPKRSFAATPPDSRAPKLRVCIIGSVANYMGIQRGSKDKDLWARGVSCFAEVLEALPKTKSECDPYSKQPPSLIDTSCGKQPICGIRNLPDVVLCLSGPADVFQLIVRHARAPSPILDDDMLQVCKVLVDAGVYFVPPNWAMNTYQNGVIWSLSHFSLNKILMEEISQWTNRFGTCASQCARELDVMWGNSPARRWLDSGSSSPIQPRPLRSSRPSSESVSQSDCEGGLVLCVSAETWIRYRTFPLSAMQTIPLVFNVGVCLTVHQIMIAQMALLTDSLLADFSGEEHCTRVWNAIGDAGAYQCVMFVMDEEHAGMTVYHSTLVSVEGSPGKSPPPSRPARFVLLPPEQDAWDRLCRLLSGQLERHFFWEHTRAVCTAEHGLLDQFACLEENERQDVLRHWCRRCREAYSSPAALPLTVQARELETMTLDISHYCSTQVLKYCQDNQAPVAESLQQGQGSLNWSEPKQALVRALVSLIADELSGSITVREKELLRNLETDLDITPDPNSAGGAPWASYHCSQLGLPPIDLDLNEQLDAYVPPQQTTSRFEHSRFEHTRFEHTHTATPKHADSKAHARPMPPPPAPHLSRAFISFVPCIRSFLLCVH